MKFKILVGLSIVTMAWCGTSQCVRAEEAGAVRNRGQRVAGARDCGEKRARSHDGFVA